MKFFSYLNIVNDEDSVCQMDSIGSRKRFEKVVSNPEPTKINQKNNIKTSYYLSEYMKSLKAHCNFDLFFHILPKCRRRYTLNIAGKNCSLATFEGVVKILMNKFFWFG